MEFFKAFAHNVAFVMGCAIIACLVATFVLLSPIAADTMGFGWGVAAFVLQILVLVALFTYSEMRR
jgi:hypothetical protein